MKNSMKAPFKVFIIFFIISVFFVAIFALTGNLFETLLNPESSFQLFSRIRPYGWIVGISLLITDILLPVPATGIMAALGAVYGVWKGMLISVVGSTGAGIVGYAAALFLGKRKNRRIATEQELERFRRFFDVWGGYAIIISRIMPLLPEVIAILAGLSGMKFSRFAAALLAGTVPVSFLFAWIGHTSGGSPGAGVIVAVIIPAFIWPLFLKLTKL